MSFIDFDGKKIFYEKKGEGKAVLFGHSYLWDSKMWEGVIEKVSQKYCCVTVDLPGHGKSESLENISLETLAAMHKKVMQSLDFDEFSIAGLSIGGMWGSVLCNDQEIKVHKFAILNSSLSPEPEKTKSLYLGMLKTIEDLGFIPQPIIEQIALGFFSPSKVQDHLDEFKNSLSAFKEDQIPSIVGCGRAFVCRGDLLEDMKTIKGKVLVVTGEDDHYRSIVEAEEISDRLDAELKIVPAGHISAVEIPESIAEILIKFLD